MSNIEKSIEVNVPVNTAYNQWTQFEDFPHFMQGVEQVQQLDDKRLHWRAEIGFKDKEWDAEIVDQVPDQRVSWRSTSGAPNGGTVNFQPVDANRTLVTLNIEYEPQGLLESIGDSLGIVSRRVEGDLERFKTFIESRGAETGSWRGEIHGGGVDSSSSSSTSTSNYSAASTGTAGYGATGVSSSSLGTSGSTTSSYETSSATSSTGTTTGASTGATTQSGEMSIPVVEEEIHVGKREVETGGIRVTANVEEVPVQEQVNLREEHVEVTRQPVNRPASESDFAAGNIGSVEIREHAEEAVVSKEARVVEEVQIHKEVAQRTETVQDTVRRTDVDVEETGGTMSSTGYTETGRTSASSSTSQGGTFSTDSDETSRRTP